MAGRNNLPPEVKLMILSEAESDENAEYLGGPDGPGLARYAVVDAELQAFVEEKTFRSIRIDGDAHSLQEFNAIMEKYDRRACLRRLCFRVVLRPNPTRDPADHNPQRFEEESALALQDTQYFSSQLWSLFRILNEWYTGDLKNAVVKVRKKHPGKYGLELELRAYSSNDNYKSLNCDPRLLDFHLPDDFILFASRFVVELVWKLSITRLNRWKLTVKALTTLIKCLPEVREKYYEPWWCHKSFERHRYIHRHAGQPQHAQDDHDKELAGLLKTWPHGCIKGVHLVDVHFVRHWNRDEFHRYRSMVQNENIVKALNAELALFSTGLENFSFLFGSEARLFFDADITPYALLDYALYDDPPAIVQDPRLVTPPRWEWPKTLTL
ncbi:hypothetical protein B0H66DRAFT_623542 [Apodospora peruviana]|uniref:Uncharacterized protein n=1 Tax=Apodospora peruviana TaxID=516989 RepID=A0AAE0I689_9PEZI|nr:hypothetical protein B0H66DRAFT_623542 [Apodospora peruviana]